MSGIQPPLSTKIEARARAFYRRYAYPEWLRAHSLLVGRIAALLAASHAEGVDLERVALAAYLHDVGRSPLLAGDPREHGELAALVLSAEGLEGCVEPARRHPVYAVLEVATAPRTLEERIVHLADRRGGMAVLPIDERISETAERYPQYAGAIERARPLAHQLEREVFSGIAWDPAELAARVAAAWP